MLYEELKEMTLEEYRLKTVGKDYQLPIGLEKLFIFSKKYIENWYAESFEIDLQEECYCITIDNDPQKELEYKRYFKKFGTVDGTGGFCAFWVEEGVIDLENSPIVNYGSEGSIHIVASNIYEFLRILTFDTELMDGVSFKVKDDYVESKYKQEYLSWLKSELNLEPVNDLDEHQKYGESEDIVRFKSEAELKYKEKFIAWHKDNEYEDISDCFEM